jgi:hypothetical protein
MVTIANAAFGTVRSDCWCAPWPSAIVVNIGLDDSAATEVGEDLHPMNRNRILSQSYITFPVSEDPAAAIRG